jgi:hypothetical protein
LLHKKRKKKPFNGILLSLSGVGMRIVYLISK